LAADGGKPLVGGGGLAYFIGPTGGYLLGFLPAAAFAGFMAERGGDRRLLTAVPVLLLADAMVFVLGAGYLASFLDWNLTKTLAAGVTPFLLGDACKVILAAVATVAAKTVLMRKK